VSAVIIETNLELPGQVGEPYHGKVGDTYRLEHDAGDLLLVVRTDRLSAFDVVLPEPIPYKGQVLNQMSSTLLAASTDIAPNWLIESPDPNVSLGHRAEPFGIEMIMRGCLLGTALRQYQEGRREICGVRLPEGLREFEPLKNPIATPTSKAQKGQHDENVTPRQVIERGLATLEEYEEMEGMARALFDRGRSIATQRGLAMADTKYEFGRDAAGRIIVIDEIHTPPTTTHT
jgi:phosphoribosylaminoimidazole-succinocarboxamide synthase